MASSHFDWDAGKDAEKKQKHGVINTQIIQE
jgi:uncharacterized DUF497 family protein